MQRFTLLLVILCCGQLYRARYLMAPNVAEETQHAVCKIVTEELQATANVTLTRELKGVCTSHEINVKLDELERVLLKELLSIRQELKKVDESSESLKPIYRNYFYDDEKVNSPTQKLSNLQKRTVQTMKNSKAVIDDFEDIAEDRRAEIIKYNATINSSIKGTFFYYYWKIENANEILSDKRGISIRSPSFTLLGYHFHILLFPHHLTSKYMGIQLKTPQGYLLKHRFTIVDHVSPKGDLSSQLLGDEKNFAVTYRVAHDRVENRNFINGDVLVIKLTIALK